jgi:hypothetical protein
MIPAESAHDTIAALGEVGLLQFKDLNADKSAFQRTYANQVRLQGGVCACLGGVGAAVACVGAWVASNSLQITPHRKCCGWPCKRPAGQAVRRDGPQDQVFSRPGGCGRFAPHAHKPAAPPPAGVTSIAVIPARQAHCCCLCSCTCSWRRPA